MMTTLWDSKVSIYIYPLCTTYYDIIHLILQKENQPTLTLWLYPAQEVLLTLNLIAWVFTRKQKLRPGQADQCGRVLLELTDFCFTTV